MRGLIELAVVFAFVIGWAVLELVALRLDKRRKRPEPVDPPAPEAKTEKPADDASA